MTNTSIFIHGFLLGMSLLMALGPQNIFLIRQGARKHHPALSAFVCFLCDVIMISGSVIGLHQILIAHPSLEHSMIITGSLFLFYYGGSALRSGLSKNQRQSPENYPKTPERYKIVLMALGFSLLNPQALIDTFVIVGSNSSRYLHHEWVFIFGILSSSLLWFSGLTATTHYFSDILNRQNVWSRVEIASGGLMVYMGFNLLKGLWV